MTYNLELVQQREQPAPGPSHVLNGKEKLN
ncbi:hypothetical protein ACVWZB_004729 [Paenibacillus polymyxa]